MFGDISLRLVVTKCEKLRCYAFSNSSLSGHRHLWRLRSSMSSFNVGFQSFPLSLGAACLSQVR